MSIGSRIKKARNEIGITQQNLADSIGKSINTIKKYESNYTTPPTDVLQKIAKVLKCNLWDFMDDSFEKIKKSEINTNDKNYIYELLSNGIFIENTLEHFGYSVEYGANQENFLNTSDGKKIKVTRSDLSQIYLALENTIAFEIKRILINNGVDVE